MFSGASTSWRPHNKLNQLSKHILSIVLKMQGHALRRTNLESGAIETLVNVVTENPVSHAAFKISND